MAKTPRGSARKNPGRVRTGISRSVLLALEGGDATVDEILERLGPHRDTVNNGTVWTILERARQNGLVSCGTKSEQKRPYRYALTDGGLRRVKWIKGALKRKDLPELRVVANPGKGEEE